MPRGALFVTKRTGVQDISVADFIISVFYLIEDKLKGLEREKITWN
jgi:hypothetical protein